jgi:hypothetical protein
MRRTVVHSALAVALILSSGVQGCKQKAKAPELPRIVSLVIEPSALDAGKSYALLLKAEELTENDAAVLYSEAAQALPAEIDGAVADWRKMPLSQLPQARIQAVLQQAQASLDLVGRGARCEGGNWPPFVPGTLPPNLTEYRQLAFLLCVEARLEIAQGQYDKAVGTIRTGLAMSRHMGEAPTIVQGMVGIAMATVMLRPVEDLAQVTGSPNLYAALRALPHPLVNIEVPIAAELKNLETSKQYNALTRPALRSQLDDSHQRVRVLMNRLEGDVAALQCVEALRHYAASHGSQLPKQLSDVTGILVPADPGTGKPFTYRYDGSKAVLEVAVPKGGTPRDSTRYEITVAR